MDDEVKSSNTPDAGAAEGTAKGGVSSFEEKAAQFGRRAQEGVHQMRDRAQEYQVGANEFLDTLAVYIKENPQRAAMIAGAGGLALGLIVGLLMRPRN